MERSLHISWVRCWERWVRIQPRPKSRNAAFIRIQVTVLPFVFHFLQNYCSLNISDFCSLLCFDQLWLIFWELLYLQDFHFYILIDLWFTLIFSQISALVLTKSFQFLRRWARIGRLQSWKTSSRDSVCSTKTRTEQFTRLSFVIFSPIWVNNFACQFASVWVPCHLFGWDTMSSVWYHTVWAICWCGQAHLDCHWINWL